MMKDNRTKTNKYKYLTIALASLIPIFIYFNRFLIPDTSYDSLYYHIFNGLRSSTNGLWPFSSHEFYPAGFGTLMPLYDLFFYISRVVLGYRLGTVLSLVAYIGLIYICYKLIEVTFEALVKKTGPVTRILFFINSIVVTELLFQLATYFVDVIDTLAILIGLYLFIRYMQNNNRRFWWVAVLLFGISLMAKPTNVIYVIPFLMLASYELITKKEFTTKAKIRSLLVLCVLVVGPTLIYDLKNLLLTGNPVFPLYNGIIKSSYYAPVSFSPKDYGFGGATLFQKLFWPIVSFWHASRLSSPHNIFNDWKLGIEWLALMLLVLPVYWKKLNKQHKYLIIFFYISMAIWSLTVGIIRYAAVDDIIAGILVYLLFIQLKEGVSQKLFLRSALTVAAVLLLVVANFRIIRFNLKYDLSWRPGYFYNRTTYFSQAKNLFSNSLQFPNTLQPDIKQAQVGLNCIPGSAGLIAISNYDKPVLNIIDQKPNRQMIEQPSYRYVAGNKIASEFSNSKPSFVTYVISDRAQTNFQTCLNNIYAAGGRVSKVVLLSSYLGYSPYEKPVVILGNIDLNKYMRKKLNLQLAKPTLDYTQKSFSDQTALLNLILSKYSEN